MYFSLLIEGAPFVGHDANDHNLLLKGRPFIMRFRQLWFADPIAASRTPPWLPLRWGCRSRRLSRGRGNPDTRYGLWRCRRTLHRHDPVADGTERRAGS